MKNWLPILAVLAGLGSFISCRHQEKTEAMPVLEKPKQAVPVSASQQAAMPAAVPDTNSDSKNGSDPFSHYLETIKGHSHAPALTHFAAECGVDPAYGIAKYAQKGAEYWKVVPDLSNATEDLETDFYGTVAVVHQGDRILVERWGMELDTGDYYRLLYCLNNKQITIVESISWSMAGFGESLNDTTWGYEHRWKRSPSSNFESSLTRFVDLDENPIAPPKLSSKTLKDLKEEGVGAKNWTDLELPDELLQ